MMSYLFKRNERIVEFQGEKFTISNLTYGERDEITRLTQKVNPLTSSLDFDFKRYANLLNLRTIRDWTLVDEKGEKLPITEETINNILDPDFVDALFEQIGEVKPEEELEKKD